MTTSVSTSAVAPSAGSTALLDVVGLSVDYDTDHGVVHAVQDLNLRVSEGEALGLVGESGCGKSATALAIMGLLPRSIGSVVAGHVWFGGRDLAAEPERELRQLRGRDIAMIFQDPMTSLNPAFTIADQISEPLRTHLGMSRRQAHRRSIDLLGDVGIPHPQRVADDYPHQLSGGMRQRVMIAMAVTCRPRLLIADEATTALDVTIQAQIIELLQQIQQESGMALLFISHDLGVVAQACDRVAVMYAGRSVEEASAEQLFRAPSHPYTRGLLGCIPRMGARRRRLNPISGQVPAPDELLLGCRFAPRCSHVAEVCHAEEPTYMNLSEGHRTRCWFSFGQGEEA